MPIDHQKQRREALRWHILQTLHVYHPNEASDDQLVDAIRGVYADFTIIELHRHIEYLKDRGLLTVREQHTATWKSQINNTGIDLVEGAIPCDAGISKPLGADMIHAGIKLAKGI